MKIKFVDFILNEEERQIKMPTDKNYWIDKGKRGKECIIYTHDDLDGIYSAIVMKEYLKNHGFTVAGYGIINYTDGWKLFEIDKTYINICLDFAEDNKDLDIYIDHHLDDEFVKKSEISFKVKSDSCYGLICHLLGIPTDKTALSVISMIDAAKYSDYGVDIEYILNFDLKDVVKKENPRLFMAAAFNQLIKRSDYKTLIEVIHNGTTSILNIYNLFKLFYPLNNINVKRGSDKEAIRRELIRGENPIVYAEEIKEIPEFLPDSRARIGTMISRSVGKDDNKMSVNSMNEFVEKYWSAAENKFKFEGFVILRNLVYFPSGSMANALRARALVKRTLKDKDNDIFHSLAEKKYLDL